METTPEPIRFRAGKKRKAYRQRATDDDDDDAPVPKTSPEPVKAAPRDGSAQDSANDDESSVAAALKLRNARKARLRGVGFGASSSKLDESASRALVPREAQDEVALPAISTRFTHQTGMLADMNDKHMMAYIESRMSHRAAPAAEEPTTTTTTAEPLTSAPPQLPAQEDRAIMQGRLMEIELPDEALAGHAEGDDGPRGKRQRLGRDGKPWRPRKRRGSDDIKRDELVEQVLRESRLDVYDVEPQDTAPEADGAADERLAEEFRRQFLDDVAQRQLRKKKPVVPARGAPAEEVLKGPKLGGSRNSRAAMRDLLLKKERETQGRR